jgi:hypothetical protein
MNGYPPEPGPHWRGLSPREQLNLAIEDPTYCRIVARHLLMFQTHQQCVDALQHLVEVEEILGQNMHEFVSRLAELERERAKFLDPNHPGE